MTIKQLLETYPFVKDFFEMNALNIIGKEQLSIDAYFASLNPDVLQESATDVNTLRSSLNQYIESMKAFLGIEDEVKKISIVAGVNKEGQQEQYGKVDIQQGEVISIVGPTGSGKSRLLADIEWCAQKDTPTKRQILINDEIPDLKWRYNANNRLVAQLSQNMNFVMDLSVIDFLKMHTQARMVEDSEEVIQKIIVEANDLAGESFSLDTPVTSLSGGQSRALMIADTAILSNCPIVLIDEIENAGIDREKALKLLIQQNKIVLMATHDPLLALMANKRFVIQKGGISSIIYTTEEEKAVLQKLNQLDKQIQQYRQKLRYGETLSIND